jgi:hypothetical protein
MNIFEKNGDISTSNKQIKISHIRQFGSHVKKDQ